MGSILSPAGPQAHFVPTDYGESAKYRLYSHAIILWSLFIQMERYDWSYNAERMHTGGGG